MHDLCGQTLLNFKNNCQSEKANSSWWYSS